MKKQPQTVYSFEDFTVLDEVRRLAAKDDRAKLVKLLNDWATWMDLNPDRMMVSAAERDAFGVLVGKAKVCNPLKLRQVVDAVVEWADAYRREA